jgi:superfamily I DNA and/or RNA helicase
LTELKLEIENKYPPNRLPPDIYEEWKSICDTIDNIKNDKMNSRMAKLQSKRVIGATCASTSFDVMKNMQFKIVILDECSQMLEPQSLLPISKFNCRKLIAVGDPL